MERGTRKGWGLVMLHWEVAMGHWATELELRLGCFLGPL